MCCISRAGARPCARVPTRRPGSVSHQRIRMRHHVGPGLILAVLVSSATATPGTAAIQAPTDRAAIEAYRDTLETITDPLRVRSFAERGRTDRPAEDRELGRLRSGWALVRLGELSDSADLLVQAADQFYEVAVRRPRWVMAWTGLGEAKAGLAQRRTREFRSAHQTAGTGWVWGSVTAYLTAVRVDSTYAPAVLGLARMAPYLDTPARSRPTWAVLDRATKIDSTDPGLWLITARAARRRGEHSRALEALDRARALPNAPVDGLSFERARVLYALGRAAEAESSYYRGATATDSLGHALYRADLAFVADSEELAEWDALSAEGRRPWLQAFWARREREAGRPAGSRLVEHDRRVRYAEGHFAVIPRWGRRPDFEVGHRESSEDFDDRGVIYIRHGEPDATTGLIGPPGVPANSSWLYFRPEGNLLLHFADLGDGWRLYPALNDIYNHQGMPSGDFYESRMGLDPRLGLIAIRILQDSIMAESAGKVSRAGGRSQYDQAVRQGAFAVAITRERTAGRTTIGRALHTDSDPIYLSRSWEPIAQVFGTGPRAAQGGGLLVAIALPAPRDLTPVPLPGGAAGYVLRVRTTAADGAGRTTLDVDSVVRVRAPRALSAGEYLNLVFHHPVAPGDQRVRVVIADSLGERGAVRIFSEVPVVDPTISGLRVDDIIAGIEGSPVVWQHPSGALIPLHPRNAWRPSDILSLAFGVAGLPPDTPYSVRLEIGELRADPEQAPRVAVALSRQATGTPELLTHSIALGALRPGAYLFTVTVSSGSQTVARQRRITIVGERSR
jgi:GWxTD domain-containing protein